MIKNCEICGHDDALKAQLLQEGTAKDATSDTISRQAAIDICANAIDLWHGQLGEGALVAVRDRISELPSAQPEIIRCKECREFRRYIDTDITFCDRTEVEVKDDDFCSRAERRTDG